MCWYLSIMAELRLGNIRVIKEENIDLIHEKLERN